MWGLKRLPIAENNRWEQMAQEASQDVCSGLCHVLHSQDNPERGWEGEMANLTSKHHLGLQTPGAEPH